MKAALLIIGNEIISGYKRDTNSLFAARLLNDHGFTVTSILKTADGREEIRSALDHLLYIADVVITSGGLGPTSDDITKQVICEYFGCGMKVNQQVLENLEERYRKRGLPLNKLNESQALVPEKAQVFQNPVGTAPVIWMEEKGKVVTCLPGVPLEFEFLIKNTIINQLHEKYSSDQFFQKNIHVVGLPESVLATKLSVVEKLIDEASKEGNIFSLAYLPHLLEVNLQVNSRGLDIDYLQNQAEYFTRKIEEAVGDYIYGYDDDTLAGNIGNELKKIGGMVAVAESCTGGYIAHLITNNPGSSEYFQGGVVCYSNDVKRDLLKVKKETLENHGAVSEETLKEMLSGVLECTCADYAIATTGVAGPGGGSEEKPSGSVWIGVASKYHQERKFFRFNRSRKENIHLFAITGLDMLRKFLRQHR